MAIFVQGHTDTTGIIIAQNRPGWQLAVLRFQFNPVFAPYIIEKGSIAVNGISLTAFDVKK